MVPIANILQALAPPLSESPVLWADPGFGYGVSLGPLTSLTVLSRSLKIPTNVFRVTDRRELFGRSERYSRPED